MDSNDPANTNSNPSGVIPATPMDPASTAAAPSPWAQPSTLMPDLSQPTTIESLTGAAPIAQASAPPAPPVNSWDQPAAAPVAASPWDAQPPQPMATIGDADPAQSSVTPVGAIPVSSDPAAPQAESPWGSVTGAQSIATSDVPTAPQAPIEPQTSDNPAASNPFLQPNAGTAFTLPQTPLDQPQAQTTMPDPNAVAAMPPPTPPNPFASPTSDPLNTAFSPTGAAPASPFGTFQTPAPPDMQQPGQVTEPEAKITDTTLPASPTDAATPQAPANPWDLPPIPAGGVSPAPGIVEPPAADPNQTANVGQEQPAGSNEGYQGVGQSIPNNPQTGPLDLSALQNPAPAPAESSAQPGNPLPPVAPTENAPTDLSHLIAGDEQAAAGGGIPGVYTPPVAADQNPAVSPVQTPTAEGDAPPPGKHLNLTKVLLVAGIPVILIVAALSAYLILGVGKQASPTDQTSLPVEQTQQSQAPLTNPPQQIVAPSPATIPEPSVAAVIPSASPSPSPAASLSPAMQAAQRKSSPSPTAAGSASPSPAASASTSLPL